MRRDPKGACARRILVILTSPSADKDVRTWQRVWASRCCFSGVDRTDAGSASHAVRLSVDGPRGERARGEWISRTPPAVTEFCSVHASKRSLAIPLRRRRLACAQSDRLENDPSGWFLATSRPRCRRGKVSGPPSAVWLEGGSKNLGRLVKEPTECPGLFENTQPFLPRQPASRSRRQRRPRARRLRGPEARPFLRTSR